MTGMKVRTKIRKAQNTGLARPSAAISTPDAAAIISPVTVWIQR